MRYRVAGSTPIIGGWPGVTHVLPGDEKPRTLQKELR